MPVNVPDNPKVYTTKYTNFKGVDYTNDPSNVWYRRSPNGLNMLPDLDGRPYKRNGWKIEFTPADFCTAAGVASTDVEQYKVDYFELDGQDWLAFYTSLGLFFYSTELTFVDSYVPEIELYRSTSFYYEGDYVYIYDSGVVPPNKLYYKATEDKLPQAWNVSGWSSADAEVSLDNYSVAFPPQKNEDEGMAIIDYTKSFFFEGQGTAGYYLFVGAQMFRFDGKKLREVKAKVPTVLIEATPSTGAGVLHESVNLLTEIRAVQYMGDGSTKTFKLPQPYDTTVISGGGTYNTGILYVCVANTNYESGWQEIDTWQTNGNPDEIVFDNAPPSSTTDNVRIVYKPSTMSVWEQLNTLSTQTLKVKNTIDHTFTQQRLWNETQGYYWVAYNDYSGLGALLGLSAGTYTNESTPVYDVNNVKNPIASNVYCDINNNGTWVENSPYLTATPNAYGSAITVSGTNNGRDLWINYTPTSYSVVTDTTTYGTPYTTSNGTFRSAHTYRVTVYNFEVRLRYRSLSYASSGASKNRNAFFAASRTLVYGNGIINQVFLTASPASEYASRVWYSAATDPSYFPDTNYIEVGSADTHIMGLLRVGQYLGVVKQGSGKETSIYLAYATSFEDITTYAVKQSVNGVGAISNGAFNILNDEPLFLSGNGVMGIEPAEDDERKLRNRSYYINKKLLAEPSLESAFSFVFDGMYWLGANNHCYVLDGSQKTSWENTKTNLQYECYYLDNIPAKCFAKKDGKLWFIDRRGNVCRFRDDSDVNRYADGYLHLTDSGTEAYMNGVLNLIFIEPSDSKIPVNSPLTPRHVLSKQIEWNDELRDSLYADGFTFTVDNCKQYFSDIKHFFGLKYVIVVDGVTYESDLYASNIDPYVDTLVVPSGESWLSDIPDVQDSATYTLECHYLGEHETKANDLVLRYDDFTTNGIVNIMTVTGIEDGYATLSSGVPIHAVWGTISDDDGSAHYLKNLQRKGSLVALLPTTSSGVTISVKADEKEAKFVGQTQQGQHIIPFNVYMKKKVKKYKRLQITCENNTYNEPFGIDEIIKSYTMGNYAKK